MSDLVGAIELLGGLGRVVLLDVRWALGDDRGHERYLEGHLPGAVFVDLETELADPPTAEAGRHPLPSLARLQEVARRWGIRTGDPVVAYDDVGGTSAARVWWLLRWGGFADVRLLDGGLAAWRRAGGRLESGEVVPAPGDVVLPGGGLPTLDLDEAAALPGRGGLLLDARAAPRYRGEVEPVDPRAGQRADDRQPRRRRHLPARRRAAGALRRARRRRRPAGGRLLRLRRDSGARGRRPGGGRDPRRAVARLVVPVVGGSVAASGHGPRARRPRARRSRARRPRSRERCVMIQA